MKEFKGFEKKSKLYTLGLPIPQLNQKSDIYQRIAFELQQKGVTIRRISYETDSKGVKGVL